MAGSTSAGASAGQDFVDGAPVETMFIRPFRVAFPLRNQTRFRLGSIGRRKEARAIALRGAGGWRLGHDVRCTCSVEYAVKIDQNCVKVKSKLFSIEQMSSRLRGERKARGLNQAEFGALGGVGLQTQSRYEKGETEPSAGYFAQLATAGVDILFILTGHRTIESLPSDVSVVAQVISHMPKRSRAAFVRLLQILAHDWGFMQPGSLVMPIGFVSLDEVGTLHDGGQDYRGEE